MDKKIRIAVDAMGGDGSPKKIIDGIAHHNRNSKSIFYKIFGDKKSIVSHQDLLIIIYSINFMSPILKFL